MGNESSTAEDRASSPPSSTHPQPDHNVEEGVFDEAASAFCGFRVLGIQEQSPACNVGFVSFFDFIMAANGIRLDTKDSTFMELIAQSEEKPMQLDVYNLKSQTMRQLTLTPSRHWPGKGLLGVTIRFDSYEHAEDQLLHVLHVVKRSPAFEAGLRANADYLLGTPDRVFRDTEDLQTEILEALEAMSSFQCYVFNTEEDQVRIISVFPSEQWGGDGVLGAEVAHGVLHRLPSACRGTIGTSIGFVSLARGATAATDAYMLQQAPTSEPIVHEAIVPSTVDTSATAETSVINDAATPELLSEQPTVNELIASETEQEQPNTSETNEHPTSPPTSTPVVATPENTPHEAPPKPRYAPRLDPMFPMSTIEVLADVAHLR